MTKFTTAVVLGLTCFSTLSAATLQPVNIEQFCVTPSQPATLQWRIGSGTLDKAPEVVIRDYTDRVVASPTASVSNEGLISRQRKLRLIGLVLSEPQVLPP